MAMASVNGKTFVLSERGFSEPAKKFATLMHRHRKEIGVEHIVEFLERAFNEVIKRGAFEEPDDPDETYVEMSKTTKKDLCSMHPPTPLSTIGTEEQIQGIRRCLFSAYTTLDPAPGVCNESEDLSTIKPGSPEEAFEKESIRLHLTNEQLREIYSTIPYTVSDKEPSYACINFGGRLRSITKVQFDAITSAMSYCSWTTPFYEIKDAIVKNVGSINEELSKEFSRLGMTAEQIVVIGRMFKSDQIDGLCSVIYKGNHIISLTPGHCNWIWHALRRCQDGASFTEIISRVQDQIIIL